MNSNIKIRLLYLTCTELIANYGIFDTQVKGLLKGIAKKQDSSVVIHLLSLVLILRLLKWRIEVVFFHYRDAFCKLKTEMAASDVQMKISPLLTIYPFDTWRIAEMLLALPLAIMTVFYYVHRHHINLIHCRSYHAGLLALIMKKIKGTPYIFDPRSSWVEEQVLMGRLSKNLWSYHLWKRLEAAITRNAQVCVVVSDPMKEEFSPLARRVEVIYTTASEIHFEEDDPEGEWKSFEEVNQLRKLKPSYKLFVFSAGNFNRWNNLDHLLIRYKELLQIIPKSKLVIITRTPKETIERTLITYGVDSNSVLIMSLASTLVPVVQRRCDYGLLVRPKSTESAKEISVKFGEYLAAGLPVICDEYIGGAASIIKQHNVGLLLSDDWEKNKKEFMGLQENYAEVSQRCREVAEALFSAHVHADKYIQLYQEAVK